MVRIATKGKLRTVRAPVDSRSRRGRLHVGLTGTQMVSRTVGDCKIWTDLSKSPVGLGRRNLRADVSVAHFACVLPTELLEEKSTGFRRIREADDAGWSIQFVRMRVCLLNRKFSSKRFHGSESSVRLAGCPVLLRPDGQGILWKFAKS